MPVEQLFSAVAYMARQAGCPISCLPTPLRINGGIYTYAKQGIGSFHFTGGSLAALLPVMFPASYFLFRTPNTELSYA